jgi:glucose-6-phosphate-specific signal transduction histidine kinase
MFKDMLEMNISDYKKEEIFKEQVADFLHDEILQDVIYIKKELQDNYGILENDKIFQIANKMINTTRGQISLYKPHINYEINLSENYYNLIQSLKRRFGNDSILIDFVCDDKLFLSPPYDLVIYRMIHELVTNIFKHSKGEFSIIELKIEEQMIILTVTNYGDYLCNENINNTESRGLKIIKREVDRFSGILDISSSMDAENMFDSSVVNIIIKIPIKGGKTYEHFINR